MARPLRIEIPDGRYHLTARGNERRDIFRDDRDRKHFIELLAELPDRFGVRLHAFVLMRNHFHLLLETPEANLSRTGHWLNVSYSVWFNRRHQRSGHLFQGRFSAVIIEGDAHFQEVGRYVHLNPARLKRLGLDKGQRSISRTGLSSAPSAELLAERLKVLRQWHWSSYPAYAGYGDTPDWLTTEVLGRSCGGRNQEERERAIRGYTEEAIQEGLSDRPWDRLIGGLVLGTEAFADRLRKDLKANSREQPSLRRLSRGLSWDQIVKEVESVKGERWALFHDRHGDWGRDAALWLGRRFGRLPLSKLAELAGGLDYTAVGAAVSRFNRRLSKDAQLFSLMQRIQTQLSNVET